MKLVKRRTLNDGMKMTGGMTSREECLKSGSRESSQEWWSEDWSGEWGHEEGNQEQKGSTATCAVPCS